MQNKNGFKNLKKRYMAVLNKCKLLNVFGTLAVAAMLAVPTGAEAYTVPEGSSVDFLTNILNESLFIDGFINGGKEFGSSWCGVNVSSSAEPFIVDFRGGIYLNPPTPVELAFGIFSESSASNTALSHVGRVIYGPNTADALKYDIYNEGAPLAIHKANLQTGLEGLGTNRWLFGGNGDGYSIGAYTTFYAIPNASLPNFGLNQEVIVSDYFHSSTPIEGDFASANYATETPLLQVVYDPTKGLTLRSNINDKLSPTSLVVKTIYSQNRVVLSGLNTNFHDRAMTDVFDPVLDGTPLTDASHVNSGMPAGSMSATSPWTLYANPYGGYANDSQYDFDMGMFGVTAGARYAFKNNFSLGFHFDYNNASSDSDVIDLDIDSNLYTFGLDMDYKFNNNWYVRGNLGFALGQNDLDYSIGSVDADEDYSSTSFYTEAYVGYILKLNKNNILIPELGLSYLYSSIEDIDVNFKGFGYMGEYDMNIDSDTINSLNLNFMLNWKGNYAFGNGHVIAPSLGVGVSQSLTGSHIDSTLEFVGTRTRTEADIDGTSFVAKAGLKWTYGNFSVSANYNGTMGSNNQNHGGSLNFIYDF